jgi:MFS transporter
VSTFFAAFAFFGAIIFLPRWFQIVQGFSPTNSGLAALPLVIGLIGSSIGSGFFVARTGRYKWLLVGAILLMGFAMFLMTQLRADTPIPVVWLWMFIAGLGVGPTFAVFTLVVQNAVPFHYLGTATSNLTFFRQIGGTVALAIVGTVFSTELVKQVPQQAIASGMSPESLQTIGGAAQSGQLDLNQLIGTGNLATMLQASFPSIPVDDITKFVNSIHEAFSLAVAQTFWIAVVAAIIAAAAAMTMQELKLRQQSAAEERAEHEATVAAQGAAEGRPSIDAA